MQYGTKIAQKHGKSLKIHRMNSTTKLICKDTERERHKTKNQVETHKTKLFTISHRKDFLGRKDGKNVQRAPPNSHPECKYLMIPRTYNVAMFEELGRNGFIRNSNSEYHSF